MTENNAQSFVNYFSFYEATKDLDAEEFKSVWLAIQKYAFYGTEPEGLSAIGKIIFALVKPQLDANTKRRNDGNKGGRPTKTTGYEEIKPQVKETTENKKPMVSEEKTTGFQKNNQWFSNEKPNVNVNVNVNDNVNENGNVNVNASDSENNTDTTIFYIKKISKDSNFDLTNKQIKKIAHVLSVNNLDTGFLDFTLRHLQENYAEVTAGLFFSALTTWENLPELYLTDKKKIRFHKQIPPFETCPECGASLGWVSEAMRFCKMCRKDFSYKTDLEKWSEDTNDGISA